MNGENFSFEKLLKLYQTVVAENTLLKEENQALKSRLGIPELPIPVGTRKDYAPELVICQIEEAIT